MVDVDLQMPAAILHEVVSNRSGMPPEGFALYYQSKQLEGEATLESWGVVKESTIEVKTRGRGGAHEEMLRLQVGDTVQLLQAGAVQPNSLRCSR